MLKEFTRKAASSVEFGGGVTEKRRKKQESECAVKIDGVKKEKSGLKRCSKQARMPFESSIFFPTK